MSVTKRVVDIAANLFADNVLLHISYGAWNPQVKQDASDQKAQGVQNPDEENFLPGKVWLINPKHPDFEVFQRERAALTAEINRVTRKFSIDGVRILRQTLVQEVHLKLAEFQTRQVALVEAFMQQLPAMKQARCEAWDRKYPEAAGKLATRYPSDDVIRRKFHVKMNVFRLDYANLQTVEAGVAEEIRQNFIAHTTGAVAELQQETNNALVKAATAFVRSLKSKRAKDEPIPDGALTRFRDFIQNFDKVNFLNDASISKRLEQIRTVMDGIDNWTTADIKTTSLSSLMDELISFGSSEGAAAAATEAFIERGMVPADLEVPVTERSELEAEVINRVIDPAVDHANDAIESRLAEPEAEEEIRRFDTEEEHQSEPETAEVAAKAKLP